MERKAPTLGVRNIVTIPHVEELTAVSDRFHLYRAQESETQDSFANDVRSGLAQSRKRLSPKYFYDELGSALFEAICVLPEYYLTRAETEILERYAGEIVTALGEPVEFVEFGSGSARKTRLLLSAAIAAQGPTTYRPIDISPVALETSALGLVAEYEQLTVKAYASDYIALMRSKRLDVTGRALALFMGSNIGNYEPNAARALLVSMRSAFATGDGLILGYDLKKDAHVLERAYDDPTGVTAAFDKNLLARINRELGGHFDLDGFRHTVRYDAVRGSVDSFLIAQRSMRVAIDALGTVVSFANFEPIHTESSHKFDAADIAGLATSASMRLARTWHDASKRFAVSLLVME
jgi:dimethylhistidine N-methyltransferase